MKLRKFTDPIYIDALQQVLMAAMDFVEARTALVEAQFTRHELPPITVPLTLAEGEAADALRDALIVLRDAAVDKT
jgi:hypothetical protein